MPDHPRAPLVCLVILNWNGYADTHECLESLAGLTYPRWRALVVDNASADDSPERLLAAHPTIELVRCAQNLGIAAGYNRGIEAALAMGADHIVVMNNDLTVAPDFLEHMLGVLQAQPACGCVMPKTFYFAEPKRIWSAGAYSQLLPSRILMRGADQPDAPAFATTCQIDYAPSACLLLPRAVCERLRFDESYFFYWDDWDFCRELRAAGYSIWLAADAHIWHKVSRSTQNSISAQRWWRILGQSCVRYHQKHHSELLLGLYVAYVLLREALKGNLRNLPTFMRGIRIGLRATPEDRLHPAWRQ